MCRSGLVGLVVGIGTLLALSACGGGGSDSEAPPPAPPPAVSPDPAANVTEQRLLNAASEPSQWMTYGGDYQERHYSGLSQINQSNVSQLGLAWFAGFDTNVQQTSTPLYVDGVIYVSTAWSKVYAFDARTRRQLWQYDPRVPAYYSAGNVVNGLPGMQGARGWLR